eukprot:TRINITY_DN68040_c7_g1_i1.p1 TRINITY_DN68040_c7_g1~~TRINITY_DN68040_c7_g1_i1.p1  ORF type:complete len:126 (+),score=21.07 TRINITY_DN68040_c7_g1_i1:23-379(+)
MTVELSDAISGIPMVPDVNPTFNFATKNLPEFYFGDAFHPFNVLSHKSNRRYTLTSSAVTKWPLNGTHVYKLNSAYYTDTLGNAVNATGNAAETLKTLNKHQPNKYKFKELPQFTIEG